MKAAKMNNVAIFWMQTLSSAVIFGIVAVWYVLPYFSLSRFRATWE
jgi:hypothetical protein